MHDTTVLYTDIKQFFK